MSSVLATGPHAGPGPDGPEDWQRLVAVGLVAGDLSPTAIARYASTSYGAASDALARAREDGTLGPDGTVDARTRARLVATLPAQQVSDVHAAVARRVLGGTPEDLRLGLLHLREAAAAMASTELAALADRAGRFALDVGDAEAARDLLVLALEHDTGADPRVEAERNLALSQALTLLGEPSEAQARLMRAVLLAEECGDAGLATRAACRFALPADWQAGDTRVVGMIERVERMPTLDPEDRTRLLATRAWVEARLPVAQSGHHQVSWIGRPGVARPLAEEALAAASSQSAGTRLLALLAWRHTHRAPQFLAERRRVAGEALAVAEGLGASAEQVEAAVLLAVDALESGDRAAHRNALTTAAAVADRSGEARLRWRALVPAAGTALMEDDVEAARDIAEQAFAAGASSAAPGLLASRWTFTGHLATRHADRSALAEALSSDRTVLVTSPLGRAGLALLLARSGRREEAATHAATTLQQLDEESSLVLTLTRVADAVIALRDATLAAMVREHLEPWSGRIAVDANGWWCDGPVDLWLAELGLVEHASRHETADLLDAAGRLAQTVGDHRSTRRIASIRRRLGRASTPTALAHVGLTARELAVLHGLATGATYQQLARQLRFSVSTVRNDAIAVYRKLGVNGKAEAAARAVSLGLDLDAPFEPDMPVGSGPGL